jgi:signal transduction histidine kinase
VATNGNIETAMMTDLRSRIIRALRLVTAIVGSVAYSLTVVHDVLVEAYLPLVLTTFLFLSALLMFYSPGIRLKVRSFCLVTIAYGVAFHSLAIQGPVGAGALWLITFSAAVATLLGRRAGIIAIAISTTTMGIFGFMSFMHWVEWTMPDFYSLLYGLDRTVDVFFLGLLATLPPAFLIFSVEQAYLKERQQRDVVERLNIDLTESNKALTTLNDTVANSLFTPLRHMHFRIADLLESALKQESELDVTLLRKLESDVLHVSRLVDNAQTLSRINAAEIMKQEIDLQGVLNQALNKVRKEFPGVVHADLQPDTIVFADAALMRIFFEFLLRTVVYFGEKDREITISVTRELLDDSPAYCIEVNNLDTSGTAFGSEFVPLYSPFLPRESAVSGTEFIIAQRIIALHGGQLQAVVTAGDRLRLRFTLGEEQ